MGKDQTSREKIKEVARVIFMKKGYAGTKTRDITTAAGINLAALNYHYQSKENLF
ncbi:MAG: TetR/AcrR family transcriptional regulator, partial [Bacteroidota bacterium]